MPSTLFSRIIAGELPCYRIYEDAAVLAFLDIQPLAPGHTLVVPKEAVARMDALSEASAAALGRVLPRLCRALVAATGCPDYNLLQNNGATAHQAVPHLHVHIIPKPSATTGLMVGWPQMPLAAATAAPLLARIVAALG